MKYLTLRSIRWSDGYDFEITGSYGGENGEYLFAGEPLVLTAEGADAFPEGTVFETDAVEWDGHEEIRPTDLVTVEETVGETGELKWTVTANLDENGNDPRNGHWVSVNFRAVYEGSELGFEDCGMEVRYPGYYLQDEDWIYQIPGMPLEYDNGEIILEALDAAHLTDGDIRIPIIKVEGDYFHELKQ